MVLDELHFFFIEKIKQMLRIPKDSILPVGEDLTAAQIQEDREQREGQWWC